MGGPGDANQRGLAYSRCRPWGCRPALSGGCLESPQDDKYRHPLRVGLQQISTLGLVGPPSVAGVAPGTDNKSFNMDIQDAQDKVNSNSPVSTILILYINVNFPFFFPAPAGWNPQQHPFPNTSVGLASRHHGYLVQIKAVGSDVPHQGAGYQAGVAGALVASPGRGPVLAQA